MNTSFCQLFYRIFLLFSNIFLLSPRYISPSPDPQIFLYSSWNHLHFLWNVTSNFFHPILKSHILWYTVFTLESAPKWQIPKSTATEGIFYVGIKLFLLMSYFMIILWMRLSVNCFIVFFYCFPTFFFSLPAILLLVLIHNFFYILPKITYVSSEMSQAISLTRF